MFDLLFAKEASLSELGVKKGQLIATVALEEDDGCTFVEYEGVLNLVAGQTYEVKTDSGTYRAVCKEVDEGSGLFFRYLGNSDIFDDTTAPGDHYCIGEGVNLRGDLYVSAIDSRSGKSISVSTPATPIDPKFLPGVCLPVVELSTEPTEEGGILTAEESAAIEALASKKCPVIVSFPFGGAKSSAVLNYIEGDETSYVAMAGPMLLQIVRADNLHWTAVLVNALG